MCIRDSSNGKTYTAKVAWDAVDPQLLAKEGEVVLAGRVEGTDLPTRLHIRVSANTVKGANVACLLYTSQLSL